MSNSSTTETSLGRRIGIWSVIWIGAFVVTLPLMVWLFSTHPNLYVALQEFHERN